MSGWVLPPGLLDGRHTDLPERPPFRSGSVNTPRAIVEILPDHYPGCGLCAGDRLTADAVDTVTVLTYGVWRQRVITGMPPECPE